MEPHAPGRQQQHHGRPATPARPASQFRPSTPPPQARGRPQRQLPARARRAGSAALQLHPCFNDRCRVMYVNPAVSTCNTSRCHAASASRQVVHQAAVTAFWASTRASCDSSRSRVSACPPPAVCWSTRPGGGQPHRRHLDLAVVLGPGSRFDIVPHVPVHLVDLVVRARWPCRRLIALRCDTRCGVRRSSGRSSKPPLRPVLPLLELESNGLFCSGLAVHRGRGRQVQPGLQGVGRHAHLPGRVLHPSRTFFRSIRLVAQSGDVRPPLNTPEPKPLPCQPLSATPGPARPSGRSASPSVRRNPSSRIALLHRRHLAGFRARSSS